jgi:hypothetical protein
MRRSEIFDDFVRIAQEKGLISKTAAKEEKLPKNPRWDSLDIDAIQALYGVKPDQPKDMEYEHNIMENAHPSAVIIAPSYDKLNGLVENNNERANILRHIIDKPVDGQLTNKKYAQKDLLLTLIRVANDLDNKNQDQLRILADTCLTQMGNGMKKQAFLPWLIGAGAVLGIIYLQQHLPDVDQGLVQNYTRLQTACSALLNDNANWGVGEKFDQQLKDDVGGLQARLSHFWELYEKVEPLIREMEKPKDAQEMQAAIAHPQTQSVMQAYQALRTEINNISTYLNKIEEDFSNPDYKHNHTVEKGALTSLVDAVPFLHGGTGSLMGDKFDAVLQALTPFKASVARLLNILTAAKSVEQKFQSEIASSDVKTNKEYGSDPYAAPTGNAAPKTVEEADHQGGLLENAFNGLSGLFGG